MNSSAPCSRAMASFSGPPAAAMTRAPRILPISTAVDSAANLDNLAGGFEARSKREGRLHLIGAANHQAVGKIHTCRMHANTDLGRRQLPPGDVLEPQHVGRSPFPAANRLHPPTPCVKEGGVPGRTRTCDPRFRKPMLYPAELRGHSRQRGAPERTTAQI